MERSGATEDTDSSDEDEEFEMYITEENLYAIIDYLRSKHLYCLYCVITGIDIEDLKENCPGPYRTWITTTNWIKISMEKITTDNQQQLPTGQTYQDTCKCLRSLLATSAPRNNRHLKIAGSSMLPIVPRIIRPVPFAAGAFNRELRAIDKKEFL
ncbi:hypothetical protein NQ318_003440 [Aromia moschata]|uniref:DUF4187 domain-containing protein n=1 Tax=Aromia moschata TaxID=1265417 RepID=A0AAV8YV35_9CUCU|nr:hypothetical protein NQ318_003440 [Aromia moschata]